MLIPKGLYAVITEKFCEGRSSIEVLHSVIAGGVKMVQLREKDMSKRALYELASQYKEITHRAGVTFIMNDHVDIALGVGADGIHLGQDDLPVSVARKIAPKMIIGCSTHNVKEAIQAEKEGASYVNIGPIFSTQTKETGTVGLGEKKVEEIKHHISIPFTVMGGIKEHHLHNLLLYGVSRIAMVTEITAAENIEQKVRQMQRIILEKG